MTTTTIEDAVQALGVQLVSTNSVNLKGYCPVHHLTKGRPDAHPSWYIHSATGAWFCFSCHARGSLSHLIEQLGGDADGVAELVFDVAAKKARDIGGDGGDGGRDPEKPVQYVSERLFAKNPYPHTEALERRDLTLDVAKLLNIRWDRKGMCWLLPVYDFGARLLGWQEKSAGYFNNYPTEIKKSHSLFGYQAVRQAKTVVLVESQLDAARLYRYDVEALALMGSDLSRAQAEAVERLRPTLVVIAMDNDKAGDGAAAIATQRLKSLGVTVAYFRYPKDSRGLDPGELESDDLTHGVSHASLYPSPEIHECLAKHKR
jgi:Toprim-like